MPRSAVVGRYVGTAEQPHVTLVVVVLAVATTSLTNRIRQGREPSEVRDDRRVELKASQLAARERERDAGRTRTEDVVVERRRSEEARHRTGQRLRLRPREIVRAIAV